MAGMLCATVALAQVDLPDLPAIPLKGAQAPLLETQPVGIPSVQSWVTLAARFKVPATGQWVQMLITKANRDARKFVVSTLNLETGAIKVHPEVAGYGQSKTAWSGGKFYFTTWLPSGFHVYDPATDAITELPPPFENKDAGAFRMSVSPDGVLTMGAGGVTEVSMYDPKTGTLTKLGAVGSPGHSWVYELGSDDGWIYAALRGKSPWELVVINKKTKEAKIALTVPPEGYINISNNGGRVYENFATKEGMRDVIFRDGQVLPPGEAPAPANVGQAAAPQKPETPPEVMVDESPLFEGKKTVAIHYQDPADRAVWKTAEIEAPLASEGMLAMTVTDDGRIAAVGGPYNPIVLFDPATDKGIQAPFAHVSARWLLADGPIIYGTGYPSTTLVKWDTTKPATSPIALPGKPAIPNTDARANPRIVALWSMTPTSGGHMGVRMFKGADGCIYICAARHRHNLGYDVVWYDPATDEKGEIEDNGRNDHLAVTWAALMDGGSKMIVATSIEKNRQLTSAVPESAKLIVVDLVGRKYLGEYVPFKGVHELTGIVEIAPSKVVGLALAPDTKSTYVYRYDLAESKVEQVARYSGLLFGQHGTTAQPGKGFDFILGPDGRIWTGMSVAAERGAALRINPADLTVATDGQIAQGVWRYAFLGEQVYINYGSRIQRVPALGALLKPVE